MESNFSLTGSATSILVTAVSQRIAIPASVRDVIIANPGGNMIRARAGGASVVADVSSMPVWSQEKGAFGVFGCTHLALIALDGDQRVDVFFGEGA